MPQSSAKEAASAPVATPSSKKEGKSQKKGEAQHQRMAGKAAMDKEHDVKMGIATPRADGKRPAALIESDSDLAPDATPVEAASGGDAGLHAKFDLFLKQFAEASSENNSRMTKFEASVQEHCGTVASHMERLSVSLSTAVYDMNSKHAAAEEVTASKFDHMQTQIQELVGRLDALPLSTTTASGSAGPVAAAPPVFRAAPADPARRGPPEDCMAFVRGFPTMLPRCVMSTYADEAVLLVPAIERKLLKVRVSPADNQFSIVFPSAGGAASFVEAYRAMDMVYRDPGGTETKLACRTGKPIALRRRGGLIMPVYKELEEILAMTSDLSTAKIIQSSKVRSGKMTTEFFAQVGNKLSPMFALVFLEASDSMSIEEVTELRAGTDLTSEGFARIVKIALG
jgi:hypothetical protein